MKTAFLSWVSIVALMVIAPVGHAHAEGIFDRAHAKFVEEDKTPDEHPDITQRVMAKMAADHCLPGENGIVCQVVLLCSRAPDIAGESLPDGNEIHAARAAMENAGSDLKRLAIASDMIATPDAGCPLSPPAAAIAVAEYTRGALFACLAVM